MNQFVKTIGFERPFASIALAAIALSAAYAFFRLIAILTDNIEASFLNDLALITGMVIEVAVSLFTILFFLAAIQYLARRRA